MTNSDESRAIRAPDDFPVTWDHPSEAGYLWELDRVHSPRPVSPLTADLNLATTVRGSNMAFEAWGRPVRLMKKRINTYLFENTRPVLPKDQAAGASRGAAMRVQKAISGMWDAWEADYLPEVRESLSWFDDKDLSLASLPELRKISDEWLPRLRRVWEIHFLVSPLFLQTPGQLEEMYLDVFGGERSVLAYELSLAEDNLSLEIDQHLWSLGQTAAKSPDLTSALYKSIREKGFDRLKRFDGGRDLRDQIVQFLKRFGHRQPIYVELANPSWFEDPAPVLQRIYTFAASILESPRERHGAALEKRDELLARIEDRLMDHPAQFRRRFRELVMLARQGSRLSEDHAFWIDQGCMVRLRYLYLEIGKRLCDAGTISDPGDVFWLHLKQVLGCVDGGDATGLIEAVEAEKIEVQKWAAIAPPASIGSEPPITGRVSAGARAEARFTGGGVVASDDLREITGMAGSAGKAQGIARVAGSLDDAGRLKPGEILVAQTTAPPWTSLFNIAAAVVTDVGGPLCHCAVVAREYGIPAVVGTVVGTRRIPDGATIAVDGTKGTVRIIDQ